MTVMRIVKLGADVLARKTGPVTSWDEGLARLVTDMEQTMHAARGIGLAANQVGLPLALAIIDLDPGGPESHLWVLTNPEIVESDGAIKDDEGCLSIPSLSAIVERADRVVARYRDLAGEEQHVEGTGLMARALCHEIDHLNGFLFTQRIPGVRGDLVRRRARKMQRSGDWDDVTP